jgi:hypothetical protein
MKKVRANALWNELSPESRKILDTWLFENNMSYAEILPKARSELGFRGSVGSLCRYRKRRELERIFTDIDEMTGNAEQLAKSGVKAGAFCEVNMAVFNANLFRALQAAPEKLRELQPMFSVMLQHARNDTLQGIKDEEHDIRREAMAFAKEKLEFETLKRAMRAMAQLRRKGRGAKGS